MPDTVESVLEEAVAARKAGLDLVHFCWIGPLVDDRWFHGLATAEKILKGVEPSRLVFWCETQNYHSVRKAVNNKLIRVVRMRDLYRHWVGADEELAKGIRHVYATLKRLDALAAAKDIASLSILHVVGGYFFDASVRFVRWSEVEGRSTKVSGGDWKVDTCVMPTRPTPAWCDDAWALYAQPGTDTMNAVVKYLEYAKKNNLHRRQLGGDLHPLTGKTDQMSILTKCGDLTEPIMMALPTGWRDSRPMSGFQKTGPATVEQFTYYQVGDSPLTYLIPELGLIKECGSSSTLQDPSLWTGWRAAPLRDWSSKNTYE